MSDASAPPFSHDLVDDGRRLVLHGDLDEDATVELRSLVTQAVADSASGLVLDLSDVEFLPSAAVGVLAKAREDARRGGSDLSFVAAPGTIAQRVLTICELPYSEA